MDSTDAASNVATNSGEATCIMFMSVPGGRERWHRAEQHGQNQLNTKASPWRQVARRPLCRASMTTDLHSFTYIIVIISLIIHRLTLT